MNKNQIKLDMIVAVALNGFSEYDLEPRNLKQATVVETNVTHEKVVYHSGSWRGQSTKVHGTRIEYVGKVRNDAGEFEDTIISAVVENRAIVSTWEDNLATIKRIADRKAQTAAYYDQKEMAVKELNAIIGGGCRTDVKYESGRRVDGAILSNAAVAQLLELLGARV